MLKNKKIILSIAAAILVLVVALGVTLAYRVYINSQRQEGSKEITVKVTVSTDERTYNNEITFKTDEEFLGAALDKEKLIKTEDSDFGRFVVEVDNMKADSSKQEWWLITVNGEGAMVGIDDLAIKDGDNIGFELKVGY